MPISLTSSASAHVVLVFGTIRVCRDPSDDVVIETALRGRAAVLVSRDDDRNGDPQLFEFLSILGISALSVQRFLDALDDETDQ